LSCIPLPEACRFAVDLANLRGGPDNITVVAARVPGTTTADQVPVLKRKPFWQGVSWRRVPWSNLGIVTGIGLAFLALSLMVNQMQTLAVLTFVLAAGVFLAGAAGLYRRYRLEVDADQENDRVGPLQVYRQAACGVDAGLLERFMQSEKHLQELARDKNWHVNWEAHSRHRDASEQAFKRGDLKAAFCEQCRALAELMNTLREQRNKDELFKPNW
jgi:protein phosphatase